MVTGRPAEHVRRLLCMHRVAYIPLQVECKDLMTTLGTPNTVAMNKSGPGGGSPVDHLQAASFMGKNSPDKQTPHTSVSSATSTTP